jgi:preprotein translocase subunit SecB
MADEANGGGAAGPDGQTGAPGSADPAASPAQKPAQNLGVFAQYVKDLSFESPGAPQSLRNRGTQPAISISINVHAGKPAEDEAEVELRIEAKGKSGEDVLFGIELVYAGLFRLTNIPAEAVQPILMIECPRLLFPFARQVIADASRNGGFPPLLVDPIDFVALYRQRVAEAQLRQRDQLA